MKRLRRPFPGKGLRTMVSRQIKKAIRKIVFRFITPEQKFIRNTYSQAGEDVIVKFLFNSMGISEISYLDIGCLFP